MDPPVVQHATHNGAPDITTFPLETVLKYACYPGYLTVGFAHAKCFLYNDTAQWFGPDITCKGEPNPEMLIKLIFYNLRLILLTTYLNIFGVIEYPP
jgi:hypothetical protein